MLFFERGDYRPEAILVAEEELQRRGLEESELAEMKTRISEEIAQRKKIAEEPLESEWRIFCAIFPGLITVMISGAYREKGYVRKQQEAWMYTLIGLCSYVGLAIFLMLVARVHSA